MKKKRLKIDFFAILHPLFLMMLGLLFYFFAFILIWFITELAKLKKKRTFIPYIFPSSFVQSYFFAFIFHPSFFY